MRRDEQHMEHDGRRTRWAPRGRHARRRRGGQVGVAGQESSLDGSWQERTWIRGKKADKVEKPKRTGSASAGLESGSRSEATCSKGGPIYSTGTDTDVGGQTGEDEYIRWRTLAWFLRCAALSLLLAASEGPRKTDRRRRADRSKTQGMHARLSGCAEERGRGTWAEAGSSSAIGRLSLGGAEARGAGATGSSSLGTMREQLRRSICEPIREEARDDSPSRDSRSLPSSPSEHFASIYALRPNSDIALDVYKRHHRPRAPPVRSLSAPLLPLISTTTTKPVHINQP